MVNSGLIVDFVNTREDGLASWFRSRGLARVPADDVRRAEEVREAVRALLLANNQVDVDGAAATAVLEAAARRARLEPEFADGRLVARRDGRRLVASSEGMPRARLRIRVRRQRQEPLACVVLDAGVRQP